jgi:hypothetical protein
VASTATNGLVKRVKCFILAANQFVQISKLSGHASHE